MKITFYFRYPLSRTMAFEKEYHPNLRFSLGDKRWLLRNAVTIWMVVDGKLVGETYGVALADKHNRPEGCPYDPKSIYCYSNTILGKYKGRGFGTILKAAFIGHVAGQFRRVYGHARPGRSQSLNKKFGARFLSTHKNWYKTGEDYKLYVLQLPRPAKP